MSETFNTRKLKVLTPNPKGLSNAEVDDWKGTPRKKFKIGLEAFREAKETRNGTKTKKSK